MKITLGWLKEHLETDVDPATLEDRLTMLGLEVEEVIDRARGMETFVVARVLEARPHPDADRLSVCQVDTGAGTHQVVCGAPNARTGMMGVFAASGAYIPGTELKLKKAKIRGIDSNGMLLSEREMGISDEHEGIIELPEDAPLGAPAVTVMGLDDPVIDLAITPNRADCLGVRGIARDLAAAGLGTLKPLDATPVPGAFESPIKVHLEFGADTADACPYFVGRLIRGVDNAESPDWLKDRLLAVGLRPISALVDITNLMTIGLDRPLHVFDADKVEGDLHVRLSRPGETLMTLNEKEYVLDDAMTVIADDEAAEALGGVMGGERTGCTAATTDVFVESAYFDPLRTAATGRKLNLTSDARYRFERGIDPTFLVPGMEIATRMILDICGGEASHLVIAGGEPEWRRQIPFRPSRVHALGGADVPAERSQGILEALGFELSEADGGLSAMPPPWRADVVDESCLVEEVVRVHGYDRVPAVPLERPTVLPQPALTAAQRRRAVARRTLAERGLVEAVTLSFMRSDLAGLFGGVPETVRLVNPISSDLDVMRPSILPNLIAAAGRNADRGVPDAALFEVGPQYAGDGAADQATVAAGIRAGLFDARTWAGATRAVDVFDAKADALGVLAATGAPVAKAQVVAKAPGWYHPGRSGRITLGPKTVLAWFGEIHPRVLARMDVKGPVAGFEVFLDALPKPKARKSAARPHLDLPALHPVVRDFAFVVDADVPATAVLGAARASDSELIEDVTLFDVFTGEGVGAGKKSLAIAPQVNGSDLIWQNFFWETPGRLGPTGGPGQGDEGPRPWIPNRPC
jgi:phenylalanyl-tRNA synthetase beta chain